MVLNVYNKENKSSKFVSVVEFITEKLVKGNTLIVVEGYEMVGKSTLVHHLSSHLSARLPGVIKQSSKLNHDLGPVIGYDKLYTSSLVQFDMIKNLSQHSDNKYVLVCDRGLVSSTFYPGEIDYKLVRKYLNQVFDNIILVRVELDRSTLSSNNLLHTREELSKFDDDNLEDYIKNYDLFYADSNWERALHIYSDCVELTNFHYVKVRNNIIKGE